MPTWSIKSNTYIEDNDSRDHAIAEVEKQTDPTRILALPKGAQITELRIRRNLLLNSLKHLRGDWPVARVKTAEKKINDAFIQLLEKNGDELLSAKWNEDGSTTFADELAVWRISQNDKGQYVFEFATHILNDGTSTDRLMSEFIQDLLSKNIDITKLTNRPFGTPEAQREVFSKLVHMGVNVFPLLQRQKKVLDVVTRFIDDRYQRQDEYLRYFLAHKRCEREFTDIHSENKKLLN